MKKIVSILAVVLVLAFWMACNDNGGKKPGDTETDTAAPAKPDCPTVEPAFSSAIPHEVEVNLPNGYSGLIPRDQVCFDYFSWRSFVALNWPANADGSPMNCNFTDFPDTPRVWEYYTDPAALFGTGENLLAFSGPIKKVPGLKGLRMISKTSEEFNDSIVGSIKQATGQPLIDKNLNYVLYDIVLNPDETKYIRDSGLTTVKGQQGKKISFPVGYYDSSKKGGAVGAIEIKATWKILKAGVDDTTKYYKRRAVIYVPAKSSSTGKPLYLTETVGLVAMHILHKTRNFPMWIWTTFEHNNNAPDSATVAQGKAGNQYAFYNPACPASFTNQPPAKPYLWQPAQPYALSAANQGKYGTQVVQELPIYDFTQTANTAWQKALGKSVWANYRLIGSQWGVSSSDGPKPDTISIPTYMSNPVVETYFQKSSCISSCHIFATDAAGMNADFSFILSRARKIAELKK